MTHFLCEGGLALNSQGDDIKMDIPVSGAMLGSTVGSCSCVNLQRFLENKSTHFQREVDLAQNGAVCTIDASSTDLRKASSWTARDFTTFLHLVTKVAFGYIFFGPATLECFFPPRFFFSRASWFEKKQQGVSLLS